MHLSPININPTWSGIYFAKNCFQHQLSFHRNDFSLKTQGYFDVSNSQLRKYYEDTVETDFSDGDMVLFPPHLHHSVRVGKTNEEQQRLTFSFNLDSAANVEFRRQTIGEGAM
jgi:ectoine hydroxylase-related dioxygenase (phytanoyl-CoA dioxygenase family)